MKIYVEGFKSGLAAKSPAQSPTQGDVELTLLYATPFRKKH